MRPKKNRLDGTYYLPAILAYKKDHEMTYGEIAEWMGITASNLRVMVSRDLNPTQTEWERFLLGKSCDVTGMLIPINKIAFCVCGCKKRLIKWSWNSKYYSPECKNKMRRKKSLGI